MPTDTPTPAPSTSTPTLTPTVSVCLDVAERCLTPTPRDTPTPLGQAFVTTATEASLSAERVLTGTANQVIVTDNGAGSTVVLSTPQDIATTSSPTFDKPRASTRLEIRNPGDSQLLLSGRTGLAFPVPYFRPLTANRVLAFDLFPNGSPTENASGFVWSDWCNADLIGSGSAAAVCGRMAQRSDATEFGNRVFNGASNLPLYFTIDGTLGFQLTTARHFGINGAPSSTQQGLSVADAATTVPYVFKGAASQSANLWEAQDSTGAVVCAAGSDGLLSAGCISTSAHLAAMLSDETGTAGKVVFDTNPTVDFTSGVLTMPNSTSAGSTTTGQVSEDTNGGASGVTMVTVGGADGGGSAAALPVRSCWTERLLTSVAGATIYSGQVGVTANTSQDPVREIRNVPTVISNLYCQSVLNDVKNGNSVVFSFERASISSCAAATTDEGPLVCTWAAGGAGTPTCTITGTAGLADFACSDTANKMTVTAAQVYHVKIVRTGTFANAGVQCTWMACADAVW